VQPFTIIGLGFAKKRREELEKHGDTHYFAKRGLADYQVRLMKVGSGVLLDLVDPELIRQYYERTKEKCYSKSFDSPGTASLRALLTKDEPGLFLSEGESWKKKKKILSNVFNFDFIQAKLPLIGRITQ
jgi:cytochrome P450